jgi:hypothetical protein
MPTKEAALKSRLIHLAKSYPTGSEQRTKLLSVITGGTEPAPVAPGPGDFDQGEIAEVKPGALEEGTPEQTYQAEHFTQQEFSELGEKQEKGELGMKVDDAEANMPTGQQEDGRLASEGDLFTSLVHLAKEDDTTRAPILAALREAGMIDAKGKVPEAFKKQWDKSKGDKKDDDADDKGDDKEDKKPDFLKKKEDKKAGALPIENASVRDLAIRLASSNEGIRPQLLNVVLAFDKACGVDHAQILNARKIEAASKGASSAIEAAKAVTKKAIELGYDKSAAVAEGKKAHAAFAA